MSYKIDFDISMQGASDLQKIDLTMNQLQKSTNASGVQLDIFRKWLEQGIDKGKSFESTLGSIVAAQGKADDATRNMARSVLESIRAHDQEIKSLNEKDAAYRKLAASMEAANKENSRRDQAFAQSIGNAVRNPFGAVADGVESLAGSLGKLGTIGLGVGLVLGKVGGTALNLAKQTGEAAEATLNMSMRTGLSVKEVGELSGASKIAGTNVGALTQMMRGMSQALSENSDQGKKGKEALDELGISFEQFRNAGMKEQLIQLSDAFQKIPNAADRDRLAIELMTRSGIEQIPLLMSNMRQLIKTVDDTGYSFTENGAKSAKQFDDALDKLSLAWEGLKRKIGTGVINIAFAVGALDGKQQNPIQEEADAKKKKLMDDGEKVSSAILKNLNSPINNATYDKLYGSRPDVRLQAAKDALDKAKEPTRDSATDPAQYEANVKKYLQLKKNVEDLQKGASHEADRLREQLSNLEERAASIDLGPIAQIYRDRDALVKDGQPWGRVTDASNLLAQSELNRQREEARKSQTSMDNDNTKLNARLSGIDPGGMTDWMRRPMSAAYSRSPVA